MIKIRTPLSLILVFFILWISYVPVLGESFREETIYIEDIDDLYRLAEDCAYDTWSKNKKVVLKTDIDLGGKEFSPIPIFSGVFDGQGHTIRGLTIRPVGSNYGFFRYLEEGGIVKNLNIEARIELEGRGENIGGIAGSNSGSIENCSFSGLVKGKDLVGGIVGWNRAEGEIINSSFHGVILGERKVGGLAGCNNGSIIRGKNEGSINGVVEEKKLDITSINVENMDLRKLFSDSVDIGGIAGLNTGIIQNSENHGSIGYPQVGYNIGGIAGRQRGYINKSINYGLINGRKEIGGIVGHMEPYIDEVVERSKLEELQKELQTLQTYINQFVNNTKDSSQILTDDLLIVQEALEDGQDHLQSLIDQTEDLINYNMGEINKISIIGVELIDRLIPIGEDLTKIIEEVGKAIPLLRTALKDMSKAIKDVPELTGEMENMIKNIERTIALITQFEKSIRSIYKSFQELMEDMVKILKEESLRDWKNKIEKLWGEFSFSVKVAIGDLKDGIRAVKSIKDNIESILTSTNYISENMEKSLTFLLVAINILDNSLENLLAVSRAMEDILEFISGAEPVEFAATGDFYHKTKEELFHSLGKVSRNLSRFIEDVNTRGNIILTDMERINDQFFLIIDLIFNIVNDLHNGEVARENFVQDVSKFNIENIVEGRVDRCKNFGTVKGDLNVGGVTGAMSIKLGLDQEEDMDFFHRLPINTVFKTSALINKCENHGDIIGRKDNIGGIVGKMDLGYIEEVKVNSSITSSNGNYVGGVAGKSKGVIVSAYVKAKLSGGKYIGGVTGLGKEIVNSYTLVNIQEGRGYLGAIAGDTEDKSIIKDNYFVNSYIHGIDGISYMGKAEPIDYENLIKLEDVPAFFKEFQLKFIIDDQIIDTIDFNYGDSLSNIEFPKIPKRDGYYGIWEEKKKEDLVFDEEIHGKYIPYLTILESREKRDGTLPTILVEGEFREEDRLSIEKLEENFPKDFRRLDPLEQWLVKIPGGNTSYTIRYLPPDSKGNLNIYAFFGNKWTKVKTHWDGKYLVFEAQGNNVRFLVVSLKKSYLLYLVYIFVLISILFVIKRRNFFKTNGVEST